MAFLATVHNVKYIFYTLNNLYNLIGIFSGSDIRF